MDRTDIIKTLKEDVEIPEVVQDKAMAAFDIIRIAGGKREKGFRREKQRFSFWQRHWHAEVLPRWRHTCAGAGAWRKECR